MIILIVFVHGNGTHEEDIEQLDIWTMKDDEKAHVDQFLEIGNQML